MSPACFDVIGNFVSITSKTLREDRTVANKKHVAYCDPPQAENLASEILFLSDQYNCHIIYIRSGWAGLYQSSNLFQRMISIIFF